MFRLKYFKGIEAAQAHAAPLAAHLSRPFDLSVLAAKGFVRRNLAALLQRALPVVLWFLRTFWPIAKIGRLVIVTRDSDVRALLKQSDTFSVPFGPEMTELAGGENSVLGMEGPAHDFLSDLIHGILHEDDVDRVANKAASLARSFVEASGGQIDVVSDLFSRVATDVCGDYFGLDLEDPRAFADWTMAVSALLFADPFGSPSTREVALAGAARACEVIDRAIGQARAAPSGDSVLHRFLQLQPAQPLLTDGKIRATVLGLATGFIPTTTLAAGKILDELLRRPGALRAAKAAAIKCDRGGLEAILLEAARLNPALAPGQWRYARTEGTLAKGRARERSVAAGSVILVATMSALRDSRVFQAPGRFDAKRTPAPDLLFGSGPHWCLGKHLALGVITELFLVLLSQPNLRRSKTHGRMSWLGPFPRRLDMSFGSVPTTQAMLTIAIPIRKKEGLEERIAALGNPARPEIAKTLDATGIVHFASLTLADLGGPDTYLLLELNVDGEPETALPLIAEKTQSWLAPLIEHDGPQKGLSDMLLSHLVPLTTRPWGAIGLNFNGTPEFSVTHIEQHAALSAFARDALSSFYEFHYILGSRAMLALDYVRKIISQDESIKRSVENLRRSGDEGTQEVADRLAKLLDRGRAFSEVLNEPRRVLKISKWSARDGQNAIWRLLGSKHGRNLVYIPAGVLVALTALIYFATGDAGIVAGRILLALSDAVLAGALVMAVLAGLFLAILRHHEKRDVSDDSNPDLAMIKQVIAHENPRGYAQNHFMAVTQLKPGWFRKCTLAAALWGIKQLVTFCYRPGFVLNMGTIHYAKWFRLPGTDKLVFQSNYDGSWESYLEDFVMKAHAGQTAVWSNGEGFPETRYLIYGGARDGDRFKRWVRRQQVASSFWYSRYPALTTDQIRNNALIFEGIAFAQTDSAARAWLDCFGSEQRPEYAIETGEVQSLVFGGNKNLAYSACAILRLPESEATQKAWLQALTGTNFKELAAPEKSSSDLTISFGDRAAAETACYVGFSAAGLAKLGISKDDPQMGLASFPPVFNIGMAHRARVLRDYGESDPERWEWGDSVSSSDRMRVAADAILLVYGETPQHCDALLARHEALLGADALGVVIRTKPTARGIDYEHFGFRDGISQPVIRGTQRYAKGAPARDVVEPGEFILGYRNNQGYFPPTPTVNAKTDRKRHLPTAGAEIPGQFPDFLDPDCVRDFGRNGTFLAVRQFLQDVDGFHAFAKAQAVALPDNYEGLKQVMGRPVTPEWIEAKMVGRWHDGTPLVDRPISNSGPPQLDNDFSYGTDDPQGLRCPLGAHIRRSNPRDSLAPGDKAQQAITNRHRLLRRGRSFETDGPIPEKGLLFLGICGDLERQFEFLQQSWVSAPSFHGLTDEVDPIVGDAQRDDHRVFTIPTSTGPLTLRQMPSFVTVRAGGYFFVPSRAALLYLAGDCSAS